jgi:hypothetical protein
VERNLVSIQAFAFKFNLYRYTKGGTLGDFMDDLIGIAKVGLYKLNALDP